MVKKKIEVRAEEREVEDASPDSKGRALEIALKSLSKKFGDSAVNWLSEQPPEDRIVIPTGSLRLDEALGTGGITLGRFWELYGPEQSGKTTLAFSIMKQAISMGHRCIFVDAEHALDKTLLVKMGIDLSKVMIVDLYTAEEILDMTEALVSTGAFGICVVDSIGALQPTAEAELESFTENAAMGLHPRLMSRMCRTFVPLAAKTKTGMLMINQVRTDLGSYGNPESTPGGKALRHAWSGRIRVSGGAVKGRQIKNSDGDAIGHRVKFEITKNKLAVPFKEAEVDLLWGKGFQLDGEILDMAVEMGFVDQAGAWFSYNGDKIGQGRDRAVETITQNTELRKKLLVDIAKMLNLKIEAYE